MNFAPYGYPKNPPKSGGGGATAGFRGGAGKPGYPVPDIIRNRMVPQEEGEERVHKGSFVAVQIPLDVAEQLAIEGGEAPEKMHVTLVYVKGLEPEQRAELRKIAEDVFEQHPTLSGFRIGGLGRFSASESSDEKDVIYASVDCPELTKMRAELVRRLAEVGIDPDTTHGFTPHVTLAYVDPGAEWPVQRVDPIETIVDEFIIREARRIQEGERLDPQVRKDIQGLLSKNLTKLQHRGIHPGNIVGEGAEGLVFDIGGGKVMKASIAEEEGKTAMILKGKELERAPHIYDVFRIPAEGWELYCVVEEKLDPLTADQKAELMRSFFGGGKYDDDLDAIRVELAKYHVEHDDMHDENFMMKKGKLAVIDFGVSNSRGGLPPKLERRIREAAEDVMNSVFDGRIGPVSDEREARKALAKYQDKLEKKGYKIPKDVQSLGSGTKGTAFDIGKGLVMKVTNDQNEATAMARVRDKKPSRVVKIYDVLQPEPGNDPGLFFVAQEKLESIPGASTDVFAATGDGKKFNDACVQTSFYDALDKTLGHSRTWKDVFREMNMFLKWKMGELGKDDAQEAQQRFVDGLKVLREFGVPELVDELARLGIEFGDFHSGNIMRRPGDGYVLIDLGGKSGVKTPEKIDVLEHLANVVMEGPEASKVAVVWLPDGMHPLWKEASEAVRKVALSHGRTLVVVALADRRSPSFGDAKKWLERSLADCESRMDVEHGKEGVILSDIGQVVSAGGTPVKGDTAFDLYVPTDFVQGAKTQMEMAKEAPGFDPKLVIVRDLGDIKPSVDLTKAAEEGDHESFTRGVDPQLASNPGELEKTFAEFREYLRGMRKMDEAKDLLGNLVLETLADLGGYIEPNLGRTMTTGERQANSDNRKAAKSTGGKKLLGIALANAEALYNSRWRIDPGKMKELGSGEDGVAFDIGGNRVLKITTDKREAISSNKLATGGKTYPHIVKIFDVFRFKETGLPAGIPIYGIVTEKLTALTKEEMQEFEGSLRDLRRILNMSEPDKEEDALWDKALERGNWELLKKDIYDAIAKLNQKGVPNPLTHKDELPPGRPEDHAADKTPEMTKPSNDEAHQHVEEVFKELQRFNFDKMLGEIKSAGIHFLDYHGGNLMKRGGTYIINDLGRSEAQGPSGEIHPLEALELMTAAIIREIGEPRARLESPTPQEIHDRVDLEYLYDLVFFEKMARIVGKHLEHEFAKDYHKWLVEAIRDVANGDDLPKIQLLPADVYHLIHEIDIPEEMKKWSHQPLTKVKMVSGERVKRRYPLARIHEIPGAPKNILTVDRWIIFMDPGMDKVIGIWTKMAASVDPQAPEAVKIAADQVQGESVENVIDNTLQEIGMFTGVGDHNATMQAGSSGWSNGMMSKLTVPTGSEEPAKDGEWTNTLALRALNGKGNAP